MPENPHHTFPFPRRTVHLDFHTGPAVPDVGRDFDPERFAATCKAAHADSVTVFAKCHHGLLYYNTDRPERHPGLSPQLDLLGQQIEALHRVGLQAPIYLSVQCDEYAANTHPEWIALTPALSHVKGGSPAAFTPGWQILDMSSPYQDFLAEQLQEVLDRYGPVDGIDMDMCWNQPSCSKWALEGMRRRGFNPEREEDRLKYAREVAHGYMARYHGMVQASRHRGGHGIWFNSRPKTQLAVEQKFLGHVEIECLPTGGWGYAYFPYVARYVRSTTKLPTLSHTARFFKSWGDNSSLKPEMALKYECCQVLSQGMTGGIGDLMHPRGELSPAVYDLIGRVYAHIEACEPYVVGGTLISQIAVITDPALGDAPGPSIMGAVRALQQLRQQFDIVAPEHELASYELVIVPESVRIEGTLKDNLTAFLKDGGALIVCGAAALDADGQPALAALGIVSHGPSPYTHTFLHAGERVATGLADYGYVMYEPGFRMTPTPGAQALVRIGEPYFQRTYARFCGHEYTPEVSLSEYAGAVRHGRVITFSVPLLEAYGKHAAPNYRTLLGNCIDLLLPQPLLRTGGPTKLETTVVRRGADTMVHLMSFSPERRAEGLDIVEDAIPLVDVPVAVKVAAPPRRVFLAPGEQELAFTCEGGYAHTHVTVLYGHAILVLEG